MGRGEKTLSLGLPSKLYWNDTQIWSGKSKKKKAFCLTMAKNWKRLYSRYLN